MQPYAWQSREWLRKKLVGKEVLFSVEYKVSSGREFVTIFGGTSSHHITSHHITSHHITNHEQPPART